MSALLQNAIAAIRMGVEDYAMAKPDRSLSAVRNFYAGVLLLAKEVLAQKAPNADPQDIIGSTYKPIPDGSGGVEYVPDGHKTIDFETTWKRFKEFGITIDRSALRELNEIRNEIEHRYTSKPEHVVREALSKAFPVTVALFREAQLEPRPLLGDAWLTLLDARAVYEAELARCRATLSKVKWHSRAVADAHLRCLECGSDLVGQGDPANSQQDKMKPVCEACGEEMAPDDAVVDAVDRALSGLAFERVKEGDYGGTICDCPNCSLAAYIEAENQCAACGYSFEWENCARCYASISLAEALDGLDSGLCPYCSNLLSKDD